MKRVLAGILTFALCSGTVWGMYDVDPFDEGAQDITRQNGDPSQSNTVTEASIRGGNRELTVDHTGGPNDVRGRIHILPLSQCHFMSETLTQGNFILEYGDQWAGGSDLGDLTEDNTTILAVQVVSADDGVAVEMTIRDNANQEAMVTKTSPVVDPDAGDPPQELQFPFAEFLAANAALDLTDVDSLRVGVQGGNDDDLAIDWIGSSRIPEPATMMLLALAGAGLGGYIRRRRRA